MKYNAYGHRLAKAWPYYQIVCGIAGGSTVSLQHIIALMLYTDYTDLSGEFTGGKLPVPQALRGREGPVGQAGF